MASLGATAESCLRFTSGTGGSFLRSRTPGIMPRVVRDGRDRVHPYDIPAIARGHQSSRRHARASDHRRERICLMVNWASARVDRVARIGSHVVIWTIVLVPTVIKMIRGWRPLVGDDATITLRAYQVLSLHPPLVGMHSDAYVPGHILYDPGPLQFVLLAVPVHIDHLQGSLWGSTLLVGLALSLAVEAMWSVRRWLGCVLVALAVADLAWAWPSVVGHQLWNPNFGLFFMLASIVLAVAVALGSFGWWPVLVFTASVTVQSQLFYGLIVVSLVVVCPFLAGWHSGRPRRFRWLMIGVGVGIVCWLPTLIQQVFGSYGNLGGLLTARHQALFGLAFGVRNLGGIVWPTPLPTRQHDMYTNLTPPLDPDPPCLVPSCSSCSRSSPASPRATGARTWPRWRRSDCSARCVSWSTSHQYRRVNVGSLSWLVPMLWVMAFLWWVIVAWALIEVVRAWAIQRVSLRGRTSDWRWSESSSERSSWQVWWELGRVRPSPRKPRELRGEHPGEPCRAHRHEPVPARSGHDQVLAHPNQPAFRF